MSGIEARIVWALICQNNSLRDPGADYAGLLDGMEAAELLALMGKVLERLRELEARDAAKASASELPPPEPSTLYIDKEYNIHLDAPDGSILPLRPMVRAIFILFLKHPEGIRLKERDLFEAELSRIYAVIAPNTSADDRDRRISRLMDLSDNAFSENASALNARLEELFPRGAASHYRIQGTNGHPRRIPLDPIKVIWYGNH